MPAHPFNVVIWLAITIAGLARAHMAAWTLGMYCLNGNESGVVNYNSDEAVKPLYKLPFSGYWMHAFDGCNNFPPADGDFVWLPACKSFKVELAENRAFTSLNPHAHLTPWGDGLNHPDDYSVTNLGGLKPTSSGCIPSPNLHAQNESMAAGTAFAISYESDITKVTPENLVVISVRYHTPWKREVWYDVPCGLPICPPGGCILVWLWIPDGCGQPNMYMLPYKCKVIPDPSSPKQIQKPRPPKWCEGNQSNCVDGAKQMLIWNQLEEDNIEVQGNDESGHPKSPAYNEKCGFKDGAQNDIFVESNSADTSAHSKRTSMHRLKKGIF